MSDETTTRTEAPLGLDPDAIAAWVSDQRWYGSKSRVISSLEIEEVAEISAQPPLSVLLAQARFATGTHDLYQLPLSLLPAGMAGQRQIVAPSADGRVAVDAVADPELARQLLLAMHEGRSMDTGEGCMRFAHVESTGPLPIEDPARPMGVEQSNSSIVFADETVLKVFRHLEPGINPELEMLRFLTEHASSRTIAPLQGYYEYESRTLTAQRSASPSGSWPAPSAVGSWRWIGSAPTRLRS